MKLISTEFFSRGKKDMELNSCNHAQTELTERRHPASLTEKRYENLPERSRSRLSQDSEVCRRRAFVRCLQESAPKNVFEFKTSTEKVTLRMHSEKTKILSNQSSLSSDMEKKKNKSMTLKSRNPDKR